MRQLHIVQGGVENGDKRRIERAAGTRKKRMRSWVAPKNVRRGDEMVVYIGGHGLFATAIATSVPTPREGWARRYGVDIGNLQLIEPPISIGALQRNVRTLAWAAGR
jgi:hypothetical protein